MAAYDLCVLEWLRRSVFTADYSAKITEFNSSGLLQVLHMGQEKHNEKGSLKQEQVRLDAMLLAAGWQLINLNAVKYGVNSHPTLAYVRPSPAQPNQIKSFLERLHILEHLERKAQGEEDRTTVRTLHLFFKDINRFEERREETDSTNLLELLERLAKLHRDGDLTDLEFEQAKKKAIGL